MDRHYIEQTRPGFTAGINDMDFTLHNGHIKLALQTYERKTK